MHKKRSKIKSKIFERTYWNTIQGFYRGTAVRKILRQIFLKFGSRRIMVERSKSFTSDRSLLRQLVVEDPKTSKDMHIFKKFGNFFYKN